MKFTTTTLKLFLTALASLSTTQARIGQTHSTDKRTLMEETAGLDKTGCPDLKPNHGDSCDDPGLFCGFSGFHWAEICECRKDTPLWKCGPYVPNPDDDNFRTWAPGNTLEEVDSENDRKLEDDTTAASGNSTYTVFVAVDPSWGWSVGTKVGLVDQIDKTPILSSVNDIGGNVTCAQVGKDIEGDVVSYFIIEHPGTGDFMSNDRNCAEIGSSNNFKCQLPDGKALPDNACVIYTTS